MVYRVVDGRVDMMSARLSRFWLAIGATLRIFGGPNHMLMVTVLELGGRPWTMDDRYCVLRTACCVSRFTHHASRITFHVCSVLSAVHRPSSTDIFILGGERRALMGAAYKLYHDIDPI